MHAWQDRLVRSWRCTGRQCKRFSRPSAKVPRFHCPLPLLGTALTRPWSAGLRRCDQPVDQVVGLHAEALAPGDLNVGTSFVVFRQLIAEFGGTTRGERDHLVRKMRVVVRRLA